ncbi:hypothetical protein SDC9_103059 [bioreactor metagenome]|uniref:Uncharacterized protein n=1 Tax=bioreactor metagenome TaxID=1076179 RepID=A0A645AT52_9ZZZZ
MGHGDDPVGVFGDDVHVVSDDDDGVALPVELAQELHDLSRLPVVLAGGRLVDDDHLGTQRQDRGDRDPLPDALGLEEGMLTEQFLADAGDAGGLAHPVIDLIGRQLEVAWCVGDFVVDVVVEQLMIGVLEDVSD